MFRPNVKFFSLNIRHCFGGQNRVFFGGSTDRPTSLHVYLDSVQFLRKVNEICKIQFHLIHVHADADIKISNIVYV